MNLLVVPHSRDIWENPDLRSVRSAELFWGIKAQEKGSVADG